MRKVDRARARRALAAGAAIALAAAMVAASGCAAGGSAERDGSAPKASASPESTGTAPERVVTAVPSAVAAGRGDLAERLAKGDGKRKDLEDARSRLVFSPVVPSGPKVPALIGLYTRNQEAGVSLPPQSGKGRDDAFDALFEREMRVVESKHEAAQVPDAETFGRNLTANFVTPEKYVKTTKVGGVKVWMWDHVSLPESTDAQGKFTPGFDNGGAQVSWFVDGVGYLVGSQMMTADELLEVAKTMIAP